MGKMLLPKKKKKLSVYKQRNQLNAKLKRKSSLADVDILKQFPANLRRGNKCPGLIEINNYTFLMAEKRFSVMRRPEPHKTTLAQSYVPKVLEVQKSNIAGAGLGLKCTSTKFNIPAKTLLGPFVGRREDRAAEKIDNYTYLVTTPSGNVRPLMH
jgi:hypothetical protein